MDTDRISTTLVKEQGQPHPNSLTLSNVSKSYRTCVWPAVLALAVVPTANIQMSRPSFSFNETCIQVSRRRDEGFGDYYEVYSSWYVQRWEAARVPQLQTVGHIQATLKFQGQLKWLPYLGDA
jgi:hypothetical protein